MYVSEGRRQELRGRFEGAKSRRCTAHTRAPPISHPPINKNPQVYNIQSCAVTPATPPQIPPQACNTSSCAAAPATPPTACWRLIFASSQACNTSSCAAAPATPPTDCVLETNCTFPQNFPGLQHLLLRGHARDAAHRLRAGGLQLLVHLLRDLRRRAADARARRLHPPGPRRQGLRRSLERGARLRRRGLRLPLRRELRDRLYKYVWHGNGAELRVAWNYA